MSPSDNLPRRFAKVYTAAITDMMDEMGLRRQTLPSTIQPLADSMRTAGYAFTVRGRSRGLPLCERPRTGDAQPAGRLGSASGGLVGGSGGARRRSAADPAAAA